VEGRQLGGVGGDEAGCDAAPVAAADDGQPVLAVGPLFNSPRPECRPTKPPPNPATQTARTTRLLTVLLNYITVKR
jgi:hypothetical protein